MKQAGGTLPIGPRLTLLNSCTFVVVQWLLVAVVVRICAR